MHTHLQRWNERERLLQTNKQTPARAAANLFRARKHLPTSLPKPRATIADLRATSFLIRHFARSKPPFHLLCVFCKEVVRCMQIKCCRKKALTKMHSAFPSFPDSILDRWNFNEGIDNHLTLMVPGNRFLVRR